MTYCVGLGLKDGLVLLSDTRTNAGVDHISTFSKMHVVEVLGERVITLLSAGNLAVTQAVVNLLNEGIERAAGPETLANVPSMFRAARLVGDAIRRVYVKDGEAMQAQNVSFDAATGATASRSSSADASPRKTAISAWCATAGPQHSAKPTRPSRAQAGWARE
jgi:putative proteasome-type protease